MIAWRRLSHREAGEPGPVEPFDGIPPFMRKAVGDWLISSFRTSWDDGIHQRRSFSDSALKTVELRFQLETPLNWTHGEDSAFADLQNRALSDGDFGLDLIDFLLHHPDLLFGHTSDYGQWLVDLDMALMHGGSAWEVAPDEEVFGLQRREAGPIREAVASLPSEARSSRHLTAAWNHLMGRQPDASAAYREAVKAVEAAAKPLVIPRDDLATLGKMIAAMRAKPEKWETTLGDTDGVIRMMALLWTGQHDRHGTDDETAPMRASHQEAEVAVHLALSLVRLFVGDHVRPSM